MIGLRGKRALVTGSSGLIGAASARQRLSFSPNRASTSPLATEAGMPMRTLSLSGFARHTG